MLLLNFGAEKPPSESALCFIEAGLINSAKYNVNKMGGVNK